MIDRYLCEEGGLSGSLRPWDRFQEERVEPDEVVLVSVLKACAHLGALDQGREIRRYMLIIGDSHNYIVKNILTHYYNG